jgi:hypothetical protein
MDLCQDKSVAVEFAKKLLPYMVYFRLRQKRETKSLTIIALVVKNTLFYAGA